MSDPLHHIVWHGGTDAIEAFYGEYRWLSNFHPSNVRFEGIDFPTVEHAYQAAKSLSRSDRLQIAECPVPGQAKRMAKMMSIRPDWSDALKTMIMHYLVRQKFQHADLRAKLEATGCRTLIEGNTWGDQFWGVCNGTGKNILGKILMEVRSENRGMPKRELTIESC
jgi:ribA/ribD-fused uncharacterized protein